MAGIFQRTTPPTGGTGLFTTFTADMRPVPGAFLSFGTLAQVAFWIVLFGFMLSLSAVVLEWPDMFYRSFLALVCHLLNFYFFYSFLIPRYFERGRYFYSILGFLALMITITPLRLSVESLFVIDSSALDIRVGSNARIGFIVFSEVVISAFASLLRLAVSREQMKLQMTDLEKNQLETELRFLKAQMSPHFLFNSINNIYSLVLLKSDQAPDALMKLSALLRYLLYECEGKVTVAREVEALKTYRDLFQLRVEQPLRLTWDIGITDPARHIEPLIVVPLLENAIKHSGLGIMPDSDVEIMIRSQGPTFVMETANSISVTPVSGEPGGIGLTNIRRRLEKAYPGEHVLEIVHSESRFYLHLEMPLL